jgi:hypothetical protein
MSTNHPNEMGNTEDCSLIEMLHLHDCLRTSLQALLREVECFRHCAERKTATLSELRILSRKIYGRFQIIWSVFQAHSSAEDEFLWPAVEATGYFPSKDDPVSSSSHLKSIRYIREESSYKKEHAEEQQKFVQINQLLLQVREAIDTNKISSDAFQRLARDLEVKTCALLQHLKGHLDKEETYYIPIVKEKLSVSEVNDLIGQIMGRRSAATMANILDLALENLHGAERLSVLEHMKEALSGTYFDRWLQMSGLSVEAEMEESKTELDQRSYKRQRSESSEDESRSLSSKQEVDIGNILKILRSKLATKMSHGPRKQTQLSKLILAVLENTSLTNGQKMSTIRCLTDSVSRMPVTEGLST